MFLTIEIHQQKNDNLMQAVFIWSLGIIHFILATAEIPIVVNLRQTPLLPCY